MISSRHTYSLLIILILILINNVSLYYFFRIDTTTEKKYSLSKETKTILRNLDDIVYFKVYLHGEIPIEYQKLENEIKYMLDEFRAYSNLIEYEFIDPNKTQNHQYKTSLQQQLYNQGISPIPHRNYKNSKVEEFMIFPGIIASYKSKENTIPLINQSLMKDPNHIINESTEQLEYLLINSIRSLKRIKKPNIALISGHGETINELIFSFKNTISEHYNITSITIDEQLNALHGIDCIIINNPKTQFSEKDKFIIDQFIMHGGRSIWIINGTNADMDSLEQKSETIVLPLERLNLDDLLFKYGVRINSDLIEDIQASPIPIITHYIDDKPQWNLFPWTFFPVINSESEHIITHNLNPIQTKFPSSLDTIQNKTKKEILLQTSQYSKTTLTPAVINLENLKTQLDKNNFNSGKKNIAILLTGEFESVFKNRINPIISENIDIKFKSQIINNKMLIISDGKFLNNQFFQGSPLPLGIDKHTGTYYGNKDFILNSIDYLLNNQSFIKIRSKSIKLRLINNKKIETEKRFWQIINLVIPLLILIIVGFSIFIIRKYKYEKA